MKATRKILAWGMVCLSLTIFACSKHENDVVVSSDGVEIRFDRQGQGNPTLIFVHGWANDRSVWAEQAAYFSQQYDVVNVDLPGFGVSGNNREDFTIVSFGDDIATIIRELDIEQAVLIGFSMGAAVVIEAANQVPGPVIGVVLADDLQDVDAEYPPEMITELEKFFSELVANPSNEVLLGTGFYKRNPEASFKRVAAMLEDGPRPGWKEALVDLFRWLNEDCTESISSVQAPIIAINSDRLPTNIEAFRKYSPSFQVKVVPDTGHLVMWDAPDVFNRLLDESIQELSSQ